MTGPRFDPDQLDKEASDFRKIERRVKRHQEKEKKQGLNNLAEAFGAKNRKERRAFEARMRKLMKRKPA